MINIQEHELYADDLLREATVVITIDGKEWEIFRKSKQMEDLREYVGEIKRMEENKPFSSEEDKPDDFVTFEEFQEEITELRREVIENAINTGGRIGRQNNLLAAAMTFALLALAVAVYAIVQLH